MAPPKARRIDPRQLVLIAVATVAVANFVLGCLEMVGWVRHTDSHGEFLISFMLPYAVLGLLFAVGLGLALLRQLRASLVVVAVGLIASGMLFVYDINVRHDRAQVVLPGKGPPCRVFWWWYDPLPEEQGKPNPLLVPVDQPRTFPPAVLTAPAFR